MALAARKRRAGGWLGTTHMSPSHPHNFEERKLVPDATVDRHASDEETQAQVERVWDEFWKPIFSNLKGSDAWLNQVKSELYDYHTLLSNMSELLDNLTNGRISKPFTTPQAVLGVVEEQRQEDIGRQILDWLEEKYESEDDYYAPQVIAVLIDKAKKEYDVR